ncbi:MAG TPA: hypothetical protein ACFCUC_11270 [Desulfobacterales bacterium]
MPARSSRPTSAAPLRIQSCSAEASSTARRAYSPVASAASMVWVTSRSSK